MLILKEGDGAFYETEARGDSPLRSFFKSDASGDFVVEVTDPAS